VIFSSHANILEVASSEEKTSLTLTLTLTLIAGGFLRRENKPKGSPLRSPQRGLPPMGRSASVPLPPSPSSLYQSGPPVDACGNLKKLNPAIISKYSELIFRKHMDNASSDDVRLLYAQANDNSMPLPGMQGFMGQQGVDLVELETDMASTYEFEGEGHREGAVGTVTPFGLRTVTEETIEEGVFNGFNGAESGGTVPQEAPEGEVMHLVSNDAAAAATETAKMMQENSSLTPVVSPEPEISKLTLLDDAKSVGEETIDKVEDTAEEPTDAVEMKVTSDAEVTAVTL